MEKFYSQAARTANVVVLIVWGIGVAIVCFGVLMLPLAIRLFEQPDTKYSGEVRLFTVFLGLVMILLGFTVCITPRARGWTTLKAQFEIWKSLAIIRYQVERSFYANLRRNAPSYKRKARRARNRVQFFHSLHCFC